MDRKRFKKQVAFILEADKEKNILRQTHLSGHGRRENDAEHAWHMAMMIYLLKEYANAEFDLAKTMMMALIHDIVEIDAGDTYAYDTAGLATQAEREEKAATSSGLQEHLIRAVTKFIRSQARNLMRKQDITCGVSGRDCRKQDISLFLTAHGTEE